MKKVEIFGAHRPGGDPARGGTGGQQELLAEVLASIRALVSAEAASRSGGGGDDAVLMLTPQMRVDPAGAPIERGEMLAEGLEVLPPGQGAPILDEEALRDVINGIVREELQGELGDRISRNLRRLIRRELGQMLEDRKADGGEG